MKNIVITRNSSLFKLIAFLSQFPIFSSFIKREARHYNEDIREYDVDYTTFNDICTFCRHFIFIVLTCFFYVFLFVIMFNYLLIEPISYLLGNTSVSGMVTVGFVGMAIGAYVILLVLQHICDLIMRLPSKEESYDDYEDVEPSFFAKTFDILSQKHHNFCNRIEMKDKED